MQRGAVPEREPPLVCLRSRRLPLRRPLSTANARPRSPPNRATTRRDSFRPRLGGMEQTDGEARAATAATDAGLSFRIVRHGKVSSLEEAAAARGVTPADIIKTLVVRRAEDDYLFVLVPGDRGISWPKLRTLLGVKRMTMPGADEAWSVTGYERGTITPLGSINPFPVIADERIAGREISLGGGGFGVAFAVDADELVKALNAQVADVTDPL